MAYAHGPTTFAHRSSSHSVHAAVPTMQQRRLRAARAAQPLADPGQGVTLADAPEMDLQARPQVTNGTCFGVQDHVAHADSAESFRALLIRWHMPRTSIKSPRLDQRARSDIVSALRFLRDPRRQGQEIEEFVLHGHRGVDREAIETAHFTRVTVHGKLLLKTIDQGKGSA